jgi:outer membrane autotransporter protein
MPLPPIRPLPFLTCWLTIKNPAQNVANAQQTTKTVSEDEIAVEARSHPINLLQSFAGLLKKTGSMRSYPVFQALTCVSVIGILGAKSISGGNAQTIDAAHALSEGPGPIFVPYQTVDPASKTVFDTAYFTGAAMSGAVQAVAIGPDKTIYIGAANGGVWRSINDGQSWTQLTDDQASESIGALSVNPQNRNDVAAAVGITSSGYTGGPLTGLMVSTSGGANWVNVGINGFGLPANSPLPNFDAMTYSGDYIFAGASNANNTGGVAGLYRVDVNGQHGLHLTEGIPYDANITDLTAVSTSSATTVYAAVANTPGSNGLYASHDGQTFSKINDWANITNMNNVTNIKIAVETDGTVFIATVSSPSNTVTVYELHSGTTAWKSITPLPQSMGTTSSPQWLVLAADPKNNDTIYVGTTNPSNSPGNAPAPLYRLTVQPTTGSIISATNIAEWNDSANPATNLHVDFRSVSFTSSGQMLMGTDGGLYLNKNPSSNVWTPLMNGFVGGEMYSIAWNSLTKTVSGAFQDNSVPYQKGVNSVENWSAFLSSGDGTNVAVNSISGKGESISFLYGTNQQLSYESKALSFGRAAVRADGSFDSLTAVSLVAKGLRAPNYSAPFVLNATDPQQISVGDLGIYLFRDDLKSNHFTMTNITGKNDMGSNTIESNGNIQVNGGVTSIVYGSPTGNSTYNFALAAIAGDSNGNSHLFATPFALAGDSATQDMKLLNTPKIEAFSQWGGAIAFDPKIFSDNPRIFVAGTDEKQNAAVFLVKPNFSACVEQSCDAETVNLTGLPPSLKLVNAVTAIDNNNVRALFAGGLSNVAPDPSNNTGSLYVLQDTAAKDWSNRQWTNFGLALPNVQITQLLYSYEDDLLAIGTFGRGAWTIPDVTSYFSSALSINLGNANYSTYRADNFTDGIDVDGRIFARGLNKVGTGIVTLDGHNTYTGPTNVQAGSLIVNAGSNTGVGLTTIFSGAALGGAGAIDGSLVNYGLLHPGSALVGGGVGVITLTGDLIFAPGSVYGVQIDASGAADKTIVNGSTKIDGGSVVVHSNMLLNPAHLATTRLPILSSSQSISGKFDNLIGLPGFSFLTPTLFYGGQDVSLGYTLTPFNVVGRTINQRNVGATLTVAAFGPLSPSGANVLNTLYYGSDQSASGVMETISGAGLSGVQATAMEIGQMASSAVSDQIAFWRSGEARDPMGITSHESESDYARGFMAYAPTNPGVTTKTPQAPKGRLGDGVSPPPTSRGFRTWGSMFGGAANFAADVSRGAPSANMNYYGGLIGVDYQILPNALIGVALGGSTAGFGVGSLSTSGNLTGFNAGLYGAYSMGASYLALNETFSAYSNQTNRSAGGYLLLPYEKLSASFDSTEFRTRLESGHSVQIGGLKATPFLAAEFAAYQSNAFTEQSSFFWQSSLALRNNGQSINSVPAFVGLRLSNSYTLGNGWNFAPIGSVAYVHEFSPNRQLTNMLLSVPGPDFNVAGPRSTYNLVQAKIGAQLYLTNRFALYSDFQGEFSSESQSYGGKVGIKYSW